MNDRDKVPAPLPGTFESALIEALYAFRARHPEASPGEIALRMATVQASVIVSGCEEAEVHRVLERTQSLLESFTDHLVMAGGTPLPALFAARRGSADVVGFPKRGGGLPAPKASGDGGDDAA